MNGLALIGATILVLVVASGAAASSDLEPRQYPNEIVYLEGHKVAEKVCVAATLRPQAKV